MARAGSKVPPACFLVALGLCGTLVLQRAAVTFVSVRAGVATALAASVIAGSVVAAPDAAVADIAKFSVFGFSNGQALSDAYGQLDADSPSPYSQFSNPAGRQFKEDNAELMQKKKTQLTDSFKRFEKIPGFIKTKQSEEIKSVLTLQQYMMRQNMEYVSAGGPPFYRNEDTPAFKQAQVFFDAISDLGVYAREKNWPLAGETYNKAAKELATWKGLASY